MKRIAAIVVIAACAAVVAVLTVGASGSDDGAYRVRAIFDSAFTVIPGEDVKVAGVKVGVVEAMDVTPDKKAAVVLRIDKPGFGDFRQDASCIIRPQSLIGEKFVECTPTQPREAGEEPPPPLDVIEEGDGEGQRLLPVQNTKRNVDLDLINNIMRLPERQRFRIILNELGAGLAGRGEDLNEVIRRANPALIELDKVLAILAEQNRVLADLARDSAAVLEPLAERRADVAGFVENARDVSQATAERRGQLEANFERLPAFLEQLRPTLERLGGLSDEMTPVMRDLGAQADDVNRLVEALGPLAEASRPGFEALGEAAVVGEEAMRDIRPITRDVNTLAASAAPLAADLDALLTSFRDTGGIERLMDYLFFQMAAINGFDAGGHYMRAHLLINTCSTFATQPFDGCLARFNPGRVTATRAASGSDDGTSIYNRRMKAILGGMSLEEALRRWPEPGAEGPDAERPEVERIAVAAEEPERRESSRTAPLKLPAAVLPGGGEAQEPAAQESEARSEDATGRLLDYLLGDGS